MYNVGWKKGIVIKNICCAWHERKTEHRTAFTQSELCGSRIREAVLESVLDAINTHNFKFNQTSGRGHFVVSAYFEKSHVSIGAVKMLAALGISRKLL